MSASRWKRLSQLSLTGKISSGFALVLFLLFIVTLVAHRALQQVSYVANELAHEALVGTKYIGSLNLTVAQIRLAELQHAQAQTETEMTEWEDVMDTELAHLEEARTAYEKVVKTDEDKQLLKDFDEHWGNYLGQHVQFVSFSRQDKKKEANEALGQDAWTEYSKITDILNSLKDRTTSRADEASRKVESISRASSGLIWIASLVAVGIGVAASLLISRNVMDRVGRAVKSLVEIAAQVTAASQQMASMSQQSASGAAEQAAALQQATASIHELSQMVNRNVENAEKSKDVSKTSHSSADEGRGVVEQMIQEMGEVSTTNSAMLSQIEENNRKISEITQVINEIGNRTKVINEIVFQTKLLSFNASVEAARAGEHGKGFAVVAEEVGNLARMSGQASHDISQLLRESVERVETIVAGSRSGLESLAAQSKSRIERGQSIAGECGEVLNQIVNHAGEVSSRVEDIAQASKEQADGLRSITSATQQLDRATQEAAKAAEEASTSAHQLADYADQMSRTLADVTEAVFGQKINQRTGEVIAFPRAEQPKRDSTAA